MRLNPRAVRTDVERPNKRRLIVVSFRNVDVRTAGGPDCQLIRFCINRSCVHVRRVCVYGRECDGERVARATVKSRGRRRAT